MIAFPPAALRQLESLLHSNLYTSSLYLILASVLNTVFGFLFWTTAARMYSPHEVGLGAAVVSGIGLLVMLSGLGLDAALIRFLPHSLDPQRIVNSALLIGSVAALVSCVVFVASLGFWSPVLLPLRQLWAFWGSLTISTVCSTLSGLCGGIFLARKQASFVLAHSTIFGATKVFALLAMATTGGIATLIGAWALGTAVAAAFAIFLLFHGTRSSVRGDGVILGRESAQEMTRFALANYMVTVLGTAPTYLIPLLIVNFIGPEANAYFYVASSISGLLAMVPTAVAVALFAQGSFDSRPIAIRAIESLRLALWLIIPALGGVWLLGGKLLLLFGHAYSEEGTRLLWFLALATLPMTVNVLFFAVRKVQRQMRDVLIAMAWVLCVTIVLSVLLLPRAGLLGVGATWFTAQASVAIVILWQYSHNTRWNLLHGFSS